VTARAPAARTDARTQPVEALVDAGPAPYRASELASAASVAVPVLVAVVVSQTWFRPGRFIAGGDIPPFVRVPLANELGWAWNHATTGAGSTSFDVVRAPEVLLIRVVTALGGSEVVAQRLLYALLLGLVAFGAALFTRRFTSTSPAVALAAVFSVLNAFVLTQVPNPLALAALGLMGISGSLVVKAAQGGRVSAAGFAAVTVGFSYVLSNPPLFAVAVAWLVALAVLGTALGGPGGTGRVVRLFLSALPWAVALNAWWLAPAILTFVGGGASEVGTVTDVRAWAWTHARSSIGNVLTLNAGWAWDHPEYTPYAAVLDRPPWAWLRYVPVIAVFAAPLVASGVVRRASVVLLSMVLGIVVVAKGLHPPLSELNLWAYDHLPAMWLLREPSTKAGAPLVLVYAALVAVAAAGLIARLRPLRGRARTAGAAVAVVAAVALVAFPHPLWTGGAVPNGGGAARSSHVAIPDGWREAASFLDASPARGKALVLPLADYYQRQTTWGYYGVDAIPGLLVRRTTIQPLPESYFRPDAGFLGVVQDVERALLERRTEAVLPLLRALGVSHVVVRRDVEPRGVRRPTADPDALAEALSRMEQVRLGGSFGVADVYEVAGVGAETVQIRDGSGVPDRAAATSWARHGPARYVVDVRADGRPFTLVLAETFDAGWRLRGLPRGASASHVEVDGSANGWHVRAAPGDLRLVVEHRPSQVARLTVVASTAAAVLALAMAAIGSPRMLGRDRVAGPHPTRRRDREEATP
jgi:arabinofuranan 3-O-arabinosyltransferase